MDNRYVDFHSHTTRSDGKYTPDELVKLADEAGIGVLALTDHNCLSPDNLAELEESTGKRVHLIPGCEVSCSYTFQDGTSKEIHIVTLMYDLPSVHLARIVEKNNQDREGYVSAILKRLREECGIELGTYQELQKENKGSTYIGRMHVAQKLKNLGYVSSVDEAFDIYIGEFGEKRAYVKSPIQYVPLLEAVEAAIADHAVPVLAHLYFYNLDKAGEEELLSAFTRYAGKYGCMETAYARYSQEQRDNLAKYAARYGLGISAASDFHGQEETISLDNRFPDSFYKSILSRKALYTQAE